MSAPRGRRSGRMAIVLYSRVPRAGRVKTRLVPSLSPEAAVRLHCALLADAATTVRRAARRAGASAWLALSSSWEPPARGPAAWLGGALRGLRRAPQRGPDLGARMRRTIADRLAEGWAGVVLAGSDCPLLDPGTLVEACRALRRGAELVLGPAEDGGYYLIGLASDRPDLFRGLRWGGTGVLAETRARAARLGLDVRLLATLFDVDRPRDLARLRRLPRALVARRAPRTAALLARLERDGRARPRT